MKETTYTVYIHISPSNKVYVGITHLKPENRWKNGKGYSSRHFASAIRKYGWENFQHKIIAKNLTEEQAYLIERALIAFYNSNNPKYGYNCSSGGEKSALGATYSKEKFSDAHKKALSEAWVKRKENGLGIPWNKGLHLKETGQLDAFMKAGKENIEKRKKPIQMLNKTTNEVLHEFSSATEAAKFLQKNYVSSIIDTALGKRKSAFGYKWKYIER